MGSLPRINWFSSDLHIGHENIIKFCNRPYSSVEEMNEDLVKRFNERVFHNDTLWLLGDVALSSPGGPQGGLAFIRRLNGTKILIRGNHDKYSVSQYLNAGFIAVLDEAVIEIGGNRVRLSHYPLYKETDHRPFLDRRPPLQANEWLLCGHSHTAWKTRDREFNVGVDVRGFNPVSQSEIEGWIARSKQ